MRFLRFTTAPKAPALLVVPYLDHWLAACDPLPKTLEHWLANADIQTLDAHGSVAQLLTGEAVGEAAISRLIEDSSEPDSIWVNIDFVRLQPDLRSVWLQASDWTPDAQIITAMAGLFDQFGLKLEQGFEGRLYAKLAEWPDIELTPPWATRGVSLDEVMPQGQDQRFWVRLVTDSQILLADMAKQGHAVAAQSIWPWGLGRVPRESGVSAFQRVRAHSQELQQAAAWAGISYEVCTDDALPTLKPGDVTEWRGAEGLDAVGQLMLLNQWLKKTSSDLRWHRLSSVMLASRTHRWSRQTSDLWRWSRRN